MQEYNFSEPPVLRFDPEEDRWVLRLPPNEHEDVAFVMKVRVAYQGREEGWFSYRFFGIIAGDELEVITLDEFKARVAAIKEHEGQRVAEYWETYQDVCMVERKEHPVFALRKHWEAMMNLRLFCPSVTLRDWQSRKLKPEVLDALNRIREEEMRKEFELEATATRAPGEKPPQGPFIIREDGSDYFAIVTKTGEGMRTHYTWTTVIDPDRATRYTDLDEAVRIAALISRVGVAKFTPEPYSPPPVALAV